MATVSKTFDFKKRTILGMYTPQTGLIQANDLDAYVPEMWAMEAVDNLYESMVFPGMVHRDFEDSIQSFGDTVNTRRPNEVKAHRKQHDLRAKTVSDSQATNIDIKLNQWVYSMIQLGDREQSLSFQDLINIKLPEMISGMARMVDRCVAAQSLRFRGKAVGGLGQMSSANAKQYMIDLRKKLNDANVPDVGRNLGWANGSESILQENDNFKNRDYNGNLDGRALRDAQIGRLYEFDNFRSPNLPSVDEASVTYSTATTVDGAVSAGATSITVDSASGIAPGTYIRVAGDYTPLRVNSIASLVLTLSTPTLSFIADGAAVEIVTPCAVNNTTAIEAGPLNAASSTGYPAGWTEGIVYDGSGTPSIGQIVTFAGHTAEYVIVGTATNTVELDRPLEGVVADNELMGLGPGGDVNWSFTRNAISLVNRPLQLPMSGAGAVSDSFSANDLAIRVVIAYNNSTEALEITLASLFGLKELNADLGGIIWG